MMTARSAAVVMAFMAEALFASCRESRGGPNAVLFPWYACRIMTISSTDALKALVAKLAERCREKIELASGLNRRIPTRISMFRYLRREELIEQLKSCELELADLARDLHAATSRGELGRRIARISRRVRQISSADVGTRRVW